MRDNNPLNVTYGPVARNNGAIGRDGAFAIFPSEEQGFLAARANMDRIERVTRGRVKGTGQPDGTLAMLVYVWSPPHENDTEGMIRDIMQFSGFTRDTPYSSLSEDQKLIFIRAYARREGYIARR